MHGDDVKNWAERHDYFCGGNLGADLIIIGTPNYEPIDLEAHTFEINQRLSAIQEAWRNSRLLTGADLKERITGLDDDFGSAPDEEFAQSVETRTSPKATPLPRHLQSRVDYVAWQTNRVDALLGQLQPTTTVNGDRFTYYSHSGKGENDLHEKAFLRFELASSLPQFVDEAAKWRRTIVNVHEMVDQLISVRRNFGTPGLAVMEQQYAVEIQRIFSSHFNWYVLLADQTRKSRALETA